MPVVELTSWEFKACVDLANVRMAVSNSSEMNHASTYKRTYFERVQQEILGACGEMALCKTLGKFFTHSVNTFHHEPDIPPDIEVRTTDLQNGCLVIRDNDPEDRWYFLVIANAPRFKVVGFIKGSAAKKTEWLKNPHGHREAWFVPQEALTLMKSDQDETT